jgi:hypothetical protein
LNRILNRIPSRDTHLDWTHEHALASGLLDPTAGAPPSEDLRDPKQWPVGDQGETGSCVGWATAEGVMRRVLADADRFPLSRSLSPRFPWMASKETDEFRSQATTFIESEGTSIKAAARICVKYGSVPESYLPFGSGALYPGDTETFYAVAARLRASSYFNLSRASKGTWRKWIAMHGPILIGMDVDATWDNAGAEPLDFFDAATVRGGHAVAIVGYTPNTFIVRNSWGASWGDGGFANVTDHYAGAAFSEAYGLVA